MKHVICSGRTIRAPGFAVSETRQGVNVTETKASSPDHMRSPSLLFSYTILFIYPHSAIERNKKGRGKNYYNFTLTLFNIQYIS